VPLGPVVGLGAIALILLAARKFTKK